MLGQTFHTFADSNDGGRDGAFFGAWKSISEADSNLIPAAISDSRATVAQCKFSVKAQGTLTPSTLESELAKVKRLNVAGLCDSYILVTNLRVSGKTESWLLAALKKVGVDHGLVLDGEWIAQQISRRADLRRYVPRVYGLGDLGQILDDRRLQQASALMSRLGEDLATFVPTAVYKRAADAIASHGFVLLLGAPAVGKSTIAATLSMAALDEWGAGVRRVDSAAELLAAWNPEEPDQLFWVDDAFGAIRHDERLTDEWARRMDQVMTAISNGAKVILTSRDYIYRSARPHLKEYAYPLLREQAVVVDVARLTTDEKEQILYNHLKAGDQPASVLRSWKPYLAEVASSSRFQPEVARRLGLRAFTDSASLHGGNRLRRFVENPIDFLRDVLNQLDSNSVGAMACVYMAGDKLEAPVVFTARESDALDLLGAEKNKVIPAMQAHKGTFLAVSIDPDGSSYWAFRHPTIREAFAAHIADDPNLVRILLHGLTDEELHRQIDCGGSQEGTMVRIPPSLFSEVVARSPLAGVEPTSSPGSWLPFFLQYRCSDDFLKVWSRANDSHLEDLLLFGSYMGVYWQPKVLGRLAEAGALPEAIRAKAVSKIATMAIDDFDSDWLEAPIVSLFSDEEREALIERVEQESLSALNEEIDRSTEGYEDDISAHNRYYRARQTVDAYLRLFSEDGRWRVELEAAQESIDRSIEESDWEPDQDIDRESLSGRLEAELPPSGRDPFDDVDAGHD
ncbi:hypothetical protein ACFVR6_03385 [Microbacterium sp. NPDC058021]|uniref:nSTAND3 domain-containing NTPase n=1 Tax=Microbacterium sp. NPDC058021 TaxID=3346306 RepID=UPI0036DF95D4